MRTAFTMAAMLTGCATVMVKDVKLDEGRWKEDSAELSRRFAFETHCDAPLDFTILKAEGTPPIAWTVGANGCGRKAVYKLVYGTGWVLEANSGN